jgi:CRISPR-associated protein Cmr2
MSYIFQFTLSPVQSFIEQSRKTQDLFIASSILSQLTKAAIKAAEEQGLVIKFPIFNNKVNGIPNRFIATTIEDNKNNIAEIGHKIEQIVHDEITQIGQITFERIGKQEGFDFKNKTELHTSFSQQLLQYFETTWAFYPIENSDYKTAYENIEHLVGAMKNTRIYTQYSPNGETGRKCSLTGERNALFFGKGKETDSLPPTFAAAESIRLNNIEDVTIRETEGLSAIAAVKRFYRPLKDNKDGFPSVAEIAWQTVLKDTDLQAAKEDIKNCFNEQKLCSMLLKYKISGTYTPENLNKHFDAKFLYEDIRMQELTPAKFLNTQQYDCLEAACNNFKKILKDQNITERKYYAVICFDGDEMGKWLSGAKTPNLKPSELENFHAEISKRLGDFSVQANKILSNPHGKTVYAGGDDFLGLVSMDSLFDIMRCLRLEFEEIVNAPLKAEFGYAKPFTFSAGIAIAHHKTPLNIVLRQAREAQATAKDDADRNAFAIAALKHSGEAHYIQYKWGTTKNIIENWDALETILKQISKNPDTGKPNFSNTFIQNLDREFSKIFALDKEKLDKKIENKDIGNKISFKDIFQFEVQRLVKKSCLIEKAIDSDFNALILPIKLLLNEKGSYSNFIETLFILRFITRIC